MSEGEVEVEVLTAHDDIETAIDGFRQDSVTLAAPDETADNRSDIETRERDFDDDMHLTDQDV